MSVINQSIRIACASPPPCIAIPGTEFNPDDGDCSAVAAVPDETELIVMMPPVENGSCPEMDESSIGEDIPGPDPRGAKLTQLYHRRQMAERNATSVLC